MNLFLKKVVMVTTPFQKNLLHSCLNHQVQALLLESHLLLDRYKIWKGSPLPVLWKGVFFLFKIQFAVL